MLKRSSFIGMIAALCLIAPHTFASTGCNYPTTLDSWSDKIAGDFLTIADVNQFRCAIEKLEIGPLRPNDGTQAAPSYAFRGSASDGMYRPTTNALGFATNGSERIRIAANGALLVGATTATTGVNANDVVLANTKSIKWVNAGNTTAANLSISALSSDTLSFSTAGVEALNIAANGSLRVGNQAITGVAANGIVLKSGTPIQWINAAGSTAANHYIQNQAGDHLQFNIPGVDGQLFIYQWGGTGLFEMTRQNAGAGLIFMTKSSADHSAPAANNVVIYQKDNGSGKGQLCARFPTGATQCFASEP